MHIVYFELINQDILKQFYLKNQNMSGRSPNQQSPGSTRQSFFFMFFGKSIELINSGNNVDINGTSLKIKFTVSKGSQILNTLREPHLITLNLGWSKLEKVQLAFLIKDSVNHQNTDFTIQMSAIDGEIQQSIGEVQIQSEKYTRLLNEGINKVEQQTNFGNYRVKFLIFTDKSRHNLEKIVKAYRTCQQFVQLSKETDNKQTAEILEKPNIQVQVFNTEAEQTKQIKHKQISPTVQKQQNKWQKIEIDQKIQSNINDEVGINNNENNHKEYIQKQSEDLKNMENEEQEKIERNNKEQVSEVLVHDRNKSLSDVAQVLEENYYQQEIKESEKNNEDISAEINIKEQQLKMGTNDVNAVQFPSDFVESKNEQVSQIKIKEKPSIDYSEIQQVSMTEESPFKLNKEQPQAQLNKKQSKKSGGMLGSQYFDRKADYYQPLKISQQQQYEVQPQKKAEKQQKNSSKPLSKTSQQKSLQLETQDPDMIQTESIMQGTSQVDTSQVVETIDGSNIANKIITENKGSDLKLTFKILLFFLILGFGAVFVARNLGAKQDDSAKMDRPKGKSKAKGRSHKKGK